MHLFSSDFDGFLRLMDNPEIPEFINQEDATKKTLVFYACLNSDEDFASRTIDMLVEKGANIFHLETNMQSILYYLANTGKDKLMKKVLEMGFKENHLNNNDYMKQSPLFYAAASNHLKCA